MKRLYFIRHGESEGNARRVFSGRTDWPLTKNGRAQAQRASQRNRDLKIDLIVSSPLRRARETAEIIAQGIGYPPEKIIYTELLTERKYGDLQGKPYEEVKDIDFDSIPGCEKGDQLIARAKRAHDYLRAIEVDNVLISGHGTVGRALRSHILNQPIGDIEVTLENEIPNAEIICWI